MLLIVPRTFFKKSNEQKLSMPRYTKRNREELELKYFPWSHTHV